jgi:hypothetical protein
VIKAILVAKLKCSPKQLDKKSLALQSKTHHNTLMIDEQETTPENDSDSPQSIDSAFGTDDLDVEGALAAVASLHELTRTDEIEAVDEVLSEEDFPEIDEFERIESLDDELDEEAEITFESGEASHYESVFPRPPSSVLHRGQLASIIPALLLIGIGAYLTFLLSATEQSLNLSVIMAVIVGGLGAILLAQWISSARWAMGSFFIAVLLLLIASTVAYLILPNNLSLMEGWPLLLTAAGTAFVASDLFVPSGRRLWLIGLILAISGLAGTVATSNLPDKGIQQTIGSLLPLALVIVLVLLVAPILRRQ